VEDQARLWAARERLDALPGFDLAVAAPPHDRLGHEVVLAVACREPLDQSRRRAIEASLDAFGRDHLLPFERVRRVAWLAEIPRTPLGKCRRVLLAEQVGQQAGPDR